MPKLELLVDNRDKVKLHRFGAHLRFRRLPIRSQQFMTL